MDTNNHREGWQLLLEELSQRNAAAQAKGGAITAQAADKASHFIDVANTFDLPLISLLDNPGVMPGPDAEKSGVLRAAGNMFAAQRRYRDQKVV
jgi:acetyl-CoA carboxylase carboxyltransferase component